MQATEAEKNAASCSDESINFRPSPNFKHMKKYLKSKFEEMNAMAANGMSEAISQEEQENVKALGAAIQPPLPPNPPPPDSPLSKIKQEVEDDEYQCSTTAGSPDVNTTEEESQPPTETATVKPEPIMCRNFVRGTCRKGSACIFVHDLILSQLPGVYTFCRNFQNKQCIYAKCKFVHATVFEKEYFFRTGYLPPHATAHMRHTVTPPPPPPPPPPPEETMQVVPQCFANPAPTFETGVAPVPGLGCQTVPAITTACPTVPALGPACPPVPTLSGTNGPDVYAVVPDSTKSPLKREWSETEDVTRSSDDIENIDPQAKKCKDCEANEFRYQYMKNKVEKMLQSTQEQTKTITQMTKKYQKICTVLMTMFKPSGSSNNANVLCSALNIGGEKEQNFLGNLNF